MATTLPASSLRRRFEEAVDDARRYGVQGALLVSRHGVPIAGTADLPDPDAFAAMHATALGAAEVAFARMGLHTDVGLIAETEGRRFVSRAVDGSMFAVALVSIEADCRDVLDWMATLHARLA